MPRTDYHKRRVPTHLQGVVIEGRKLGPAVYVPLRDGMTEARAVAFTEDLIARARDRLNYKLTDADAWEIATAICDQHDALNRSDLSFHEQMMLMQVSTPGGGPDARGWLRRMGRDFSTEDQSRVGQWVERVHRQRVRVGLVESLIRMDDPGALEGLPVRPEPAGPPPPPAKLEVSIRAAAGRTPLHSEFTKQFFEARQRSFNYRSALRQFRTVCGDKEVHRYTPDDCWRFRNWLDTEARDEKKGQPLAGQTKLHKLGAVRSLFDFAIEKRHLDDNPMQNVKAFSKSEGVKKQRRLYSAQELKAIYIDGPQRAAEWQHWLPIVGLYAGLRLREALQLKPEDVSDEFGVWHFIIRPSRGQRVKGNKTRLVPIHKELIRLGIVKLAQRAQREKRDWLFKDVPLVVAKGRDFNAPDTETIMVPSQNAATQWFGRYSDECGVSDPNLDFHALR